MNRFSLRGDRPDDSRDHIENSKYESNQDESYKNTNNILGEIKPIEEEEDGNEEDFDKMYSN